MFSVLLLLGGILFLYLGAEAMVRGASRLTLGLGLSSLVVGLTVVSFSTSLPEGMASLFAQLQGDHGDIALANIIGSNIANIGLIIGLTAWIHPLHFSSYVTTREMPLMLATLVILLGAMGWGSIGRFTGCLFLLLLVAYTLFQIKIGQEENDADWKKMKPLPWWEEYGMDLLLIAAGIGFLILGGHFLIRGAVDLSRFLGISDRIVGLTVVAIGTSCPELATSLVSALRGHKEISIGNVIGSNIFNSLFIIGAVALIAPIHFSSKLLYVDGPIMLAFSLLLWFLIWRRHRVSRRSGALILAAYAGYMIYLTQ